MGKAEELSKLMNEMEYIQSFSWRRRYLIEEDGLTTDAILILMPSLNYLGEKCLKITFYDVCDMRYAGLEGTIFHPVFEVFDISDRHWQHCHYLISEVEDELSLKCDTFEYEWIEIEE